MWRAALLLSVFVLSLSSAAPETPTGAPPGSKLDTYLRLQGITMADLEENRRGRATPAQIDRLRGGLAKRQIFPLVIAAVTFLVVLGVSIFFYRRSRRAVVFVTPAIFALLFIPIYFLLGRGAVTTHAEIAEDKLATITGPVTWVMAQELRDTFAMRVRDHQLKGYGMLPMARHLEATKEAVKAYYFPRSEILVSVEPLTPSSE